MKNFHKFYLIMINDGSGDWRPVQRFKPFFDLKTAISFFDDAIANGSIEEQFCIMKFENDIFEIHGDVCMGGWEL